MNLSPKDRFLKSTDARAHLDLVANPVFHHALESALSEMQLSVAKSSDPAANWHRLEGAKQFVEILLNLADPPKARRRGLPRENLEPT